MSDDEIEYPELMEAFRKFDKKQKQQLESWLLNWCEFIIESYKQSDDTWDLEDELYYALRDM